ncbi:proton channel OTOP2-like [Cololabis saira]|uniref:proton channel OTOP2-like n=1 Tax=Cololabis saira TaxID=129043 RepID=UPI002AD35219|nr:proton channel OTOP2-like [Cololabis saira]
MCFKAECQCLTSGDLCEPCKMTTKDKEMEEAHLSNSIGAAGQAESTNEPEGNISSSEVVRDRGRNWGWMLSGIICVNILILGCALVSGTASNAVKISTPDLQIFLIILQLLSCIWMIYYTIFTAKTENAVVHKDDHAGPIWLRGGLMLFGLLSIAMDIFKVASYVGYLHCDSAVKVAFPVIQLVFVLVQTYFLWIHAKDCVQLQKNLSLCGLMLILSTNLVIWMTAVTEESLHQTTAPDYDSNVTKISGRSFYISKAGYGDDHCKCSHSSCGVFKEAYYYLYPFNIEYSLFASAMAYVMWKNVGRAAAEHTSHHHIKFSLKEVFIGPVLGVFLVIAGLATFIVYEIKMKTYDNEEDKDSAVMMHFVMNIVIVTMMSVCTVIGSAIFKVDHREHVSEKNPTRSLDVGLLVGASLGQFIISYFSVVAMVATRAKGYLNRLNLTWGILMVIQLGLQNYFIIEGLHREPFHEVEPDSVVANPYVVESGQDVNDLERVDVDNKASPETEAHSHAGTAEHKHKLLWKRRVLREVCAFLLLCNIILWVMPAFGARPQFDHDTETEFYKFNMWAAIVNVGLPFGIFYRMHSVASLFEVFLNS